MTESRAPVFRSLALTTAADALRDEEVDRTRGFIKLGWPVAIGAIIATLALPGDRELGRMLVISIAVTALISVVVYRKLRDVSSLRSPAMPVLAFACVGCGTLATLYCGYFAGAPLMIALGVYFFCRTESGAPALAIFVVASGAQ
ncbi:MAG TPA: hypothetical protein VF403_16870, partial [Kofleriaceae bacterium]